MIFPAVTPVLHCNTHGDCVLTGHGQFLAIIFFVVILLAIITAVLVLLSRKEGP